MKINPDQKINQFVFEDISKILTNYNVIVSKRVKLNDQNFGKEFLNDSETKKCRFCKKSYPDVKFKKEAHAIPEFMGNNKLFAKYECDSCNSYFAKFENEMANYMLPHSTFAGIKGKNGIPKYKLKGKPSIEHVDDCISIKNVPNSILKSDLSNGVQLDLKLPTYIPDYIYRCLMKICLGIIPQAQLVRYEESIKWLMNVNLDTNTQSSMLMSIYSSEHQMDEIVCTLLELKDDSEKDFINSIFFLSYGNFAFQTFLPYNSMTKLDAKLKAYPFVVPPNLDLYLKNERPLNLINLKSKQKQVNENISFDITNNE